jgi:thiamine-phosphate pyrophosphorylase
MRPEQWATRPAPPSLVGKETMSGSAAPELAARLAAARLYVVTAASHEPAQVEDVVRAACCGGADVVQLRRKGDDALATLRLAESCRTITAAAGVLFVVNDRLDVAMAAAADGVHLGQDDLPLAAARRLWPGRVVGRSTHSLAQAVAAEAEGADYLGVGPVYATPTKPGRPAVGLSLVGSAARAVGIPWFAIGGVDASNVAAVLGAGARRIAVVRAVCDAPDVTAATRELAATLMRATAAEVVA